MTSWWERAGMRYTGGMMRMQRRHWGEGGNRVHGGRTPDGTDHSDRGAAISAAIPYGIKHPGLPEHFDGCGTSFDICHTLDWNNGGLITARHNEICDGIANLAKQGLKPHSRAWRPQHLHRSLRAGKEGQYQRVTFKVRRRTEGGSPHQRPLYSLYGQYSRHACREYWCHLLPFQIPQELPGNHWEGKVKEVYWRLPQTLSTLHSLHCLSGPPSQGQVGGGTETYHQLPHDEVKETIITYLRVREE